jgi:hypothetical protein
MDTVAPRDRSSAIAGIALWGAMTNLVVHVGHATPGFAVKLDRRAARAAVEALIAGQPHKDWAAAHTDTLVDRYLAFLVVRDLGRALHAREPQPEPTCPMHAWETDDAAVAEFVGGAWDLAAAPGGKPWRWCDEPKPQMRLREPP